MKGKKLQCILAFIVAVLLLGTSLPVTAMAVEDTSSVLQKEDAVVVSESENTDGGEVISGMEKSSDLPAEISDGDEFVLRKETADDSKGEKSVIQEENSDDPNGAKAFLKGENEDASNGTEAALQGVNEEASDSEQSVLQEKGDALTHEEGSSESISGTEKTTEQEITEPEAESNDATDEIISPQKETASENTKEKKIRSYQKSNNDEGKEYQITYILNGGINSKYNPSSYTEDDWYIDLYDPSKKGAEFIGWYDENDELISEIDCSECRNRVITAKWEAIEYYIDYDLNGGTNHKNNPSSYNIDSDTIVLGIPSKKGYVFYGWFNQDGKRVEVIPKGSEGDLELEANWVACRYKIDFNKNGGSGTMNVQEMEYGTTKKLAANKFSYKKAGYHFAGWNTKKNGKGKSYKDKASVKNLTAENNAVVTLYAMWEKNTYTVKFSKNGGSGSMSKLNCKYGKSYKLPNVKFKKSGYLFTGWNTKSNGKGKSYKNQASVKNLTAKNKGVVNLFAQWKRNSYTVRFSGNGASGYMQDITCIYGKTYKLPKVKFYDSDASFMGWNTKRNGSGKTYKDQAGIRDLVSKSKKSITLYAMWSYPVQDIYLPVMVNDSINLTQGFVYDLQPSIYPARSTDQITYMSSNPAVATVKQTARDRALITGVNAGSTLITVKASSGKTASFWVNVRPNVYYGSPSYDVFHYDYGGPQMEMKDAYYANGNLVVDAVVANNRMFTADYFDYINISVYDRNSNVIASKVFGTTWIGLNAYGIKEMTFVFENPVWSDIGQGGVYFQYGYYYHYTY